MFSNKISFVSSALIAGFALTANAENAILDHQGFASSGLLKERVIISDGGTIWAYQNFGKEMAGLGQLDDVEMGQVQALSMLALREWMTDYDGEILVGYWHSFDLVSNGRLVQYETSAPQDATRNLIQHLRTLAREVLRHTQSVSTQSGIDTRQFPERKGVPSLSGGIDMRTFPKRKDVPALSGGVDMRTFPKRKDVPSLSGGIDMRTFPKRKDVPALSAPDTRHFPVRPR